MEHESPLLADSCYKPQPESRGWCCAISGYSPGAIFSNAYNRTRPEAGVQFGRRAATNLLADITNSHLTPD